MASTAELRTLAGSRQRAPAAPPRLAGLTVVLPCYDEAENVAAAVADATAAARLAARAHEIVVVDDGSSDRTAAIAAGLAKTDPRVRLVMHAHNRGYGDALRSGIAAATMPWILLTDADLQFDLRELVQFVPHTADAELVVGWRRQRSDPFARRLNAAGWNWLVRRAFGIEVHDVDCAFKLVRRELAQGCELTATGAMISTELLVRCRQQGARLHELEVRHLPRAAGRQSGANLHVIARAFRELTRMRRTLGAPVSGPR